LAKKLLNIEGNKTSWGRVQLVEFVKSSVSILWRWQLRWVHY